MNNPAIALILQAKTLNYFVGENQVGPHALAHENINNWLEEALILLHQESMKDLE